MTLKLLFWEKSEMYSFLNFVRLLISSHYFFIYRYFLIMDISAIWIYTYTGRLHLNPKYSGVQAQLPHLTNKLTSLGLHYVAICDCSDRSCKQSMFYNYYYRNLVCSVTSFKIYLKLNLEVASELKVL